MKDPLHPGPTPYELLEVSLSASPEQLSLAYGARLKQAPQLLTRLSAARMALQDPIERAHVDAFLYPDADLTRLANGAAPDAAALLRPARANTERAWVETFRRLFPDAGILHCLCVCWYWGAVTRENGSRLPDREWSLALAGWAALLSSPDFCATLVPADRDQLSARIADRLRNDLGNREQASRQADDPTAADAYRRLAQEFDAELGIARAVAAAHCRLGYGELACGPMLLQLLDLYDWVMNDLLCRERQYPADAGQPAAAARRALSRLSRAEWLLKQGDPQAAIDAVQSLPESERAAADAQALLAEARHQIGVRLVESGQIAKALTVWQALFTSGPDAAERARAEIVRVCMKTAAEWQHSKRPSAIQLLEQGFEITQDSQLALALGELLFLEGVRESTGLLDAADDTALVAAAAIEPLRRVLVNLERATALGSESAAQQARFIRSRLSRNVVRQRQRGTLDFNSLSARARERYVDVLHGRGTVPPIIAERQSVSRGALAMLVISPMALAIAMAIGYGKAGGFAYQGIVFLVVYAILIAGCFFAAFEWKYWRIVRQAVPYPPGRYLFPLDFIEADTATLRVQPLHDAKVDVIHHHTKGRYSHTALSLAFPDGSTAAFRLAPKADADRALQQFEHARQLERESVRGLPIDELRALDPLEVA